MEKSWRHGQFVWREMLCPDVAKAKAFYGELLGWSFDDMPMGPFTYTLARKGDKQVGGLMPSTPEMGPPAWLSYVSVKDADETVRAAESHGGKLMMPIGSAPGVGRFGVIKDVTGGYFGILQGESAGDAPGMPGPGEFCWETLNTTDLEKSKAFYGAVLGWAAGAGMGGGMPVMNAGEAMVADFEPTQPGLPTHWLTHVVVPGKLEASREKAEKLGAKALAPIIDIPKVGRIAIMQDPIGAVISLFEPGMPAT
jgi:predicted enzyme related to lactoylglutathione lyase